LDPSDAPLVPSPRHSYRPSRPAHKPQAQLSYVWVWFYVPAGTGNHLTWTKLFTWPSAFGSVMFSCSLHSHLPSTMYLYSYRPSFRKQRPKRCKINTAMWQVHCYICIHKVWQAVFYAS
jgi:hypothetical protein